MVELEPVPLVLLNRNAAIELEISVNLTHNVVSDQQSMASLAHLTCYYKLLINICAINPNTARYSIEDREKGNLPNQTAVQHPQSLTHRNARVC